MASCPSVVAAGICLAACASRGGRPTPLASTSTPTQAPPVATARPHLVRLVPDTGNGAVGATITVSLEGTGLTADHNRVHFGWLDAGDAASADGRMLRFVVPSSIPVAGDAPPPRVQPGGYAVYVVNANGTSDSLTFTLLGARR